MQSDGLSRSERFPYVAGQRDTHHLPLCDVLVRVLYKVENVDPNGILLKSETKGKLRTATADF